MLRGKGHKEASEVGYEGWTATRRTDFPKSVRLPTSSGLAVARADVVAFQT